MKPLENIIGNYSMIKEGNLAHRRYFLNQKISERNDWYDRRQFVF